MTFEHVPQAPFTPCASRIARAICTDSRITTSPPPQDFRSWALIHRNLTLFKAESSADVAREGLGLLPRG